MSTDEQRLRLGRVAEERRKALGVPVMRVLPARQTWERVKNGLTVSERTLRKLEESLQWEPLSADAILDGGDPRPRTERSETAAKEDLGGEIQAAFYITEAGKLIAGIAGNTPEEREQVLRLLRAGAGRLRSRDDNV